MKYLINLSRFITESEKKQIINDLKKQKINARNDSWSQKKLILDKPVYKKPYIAKQIKIEKEFYAETITDIINQLNNYKIKNISGKVFNKVPFHLKAINDRFLKKNKFLENGKKIYLEARQEKNKTQVRFGEIIEDIKTEKIKYPDIAIETPFTIGEISDFVRLAKSFNVKLYIITLNNKNSKEAINRFLKENSFKKADVRIENDYKKLKSKYIILAFSLWGKDSITDIKEFKNKNTLLLFGNENRGLLKESMEFSRKIIKIGRGSEPLRATQANSFAFGAIYSFFKSS